MAELLKEYGVQFERVYHCPHTPEDDCDCRKPSIGMMKQASEDLGFDPQDAIMIGDKEADMGVGRNSASLTILVRTGKGAQHEERCRGLADYVVDDLRGAAEVIASL